MAYEVRQKNNQYYVVDTVTNAVRGKGYADESDADDRADDLNFRAETRDVLSRIPRTEMTAEEKAAAYDKLLADKAKEGDGNLPPKQEPTDKTKQTPSKKRISYWGDVENEA